jgi:hypothetical protein
MTEADNIGAGVEPRWVPPLDANGRSEITHLRYSAVTTDPDRFLQSEGWS